MIARLAAAAVIVLLLSGASCTRNVKRVPALCDVMCTTPCVGEDGDTGVRVTGDPDSAETWDEIGGEVRQQLTDKLRTCELHRRACHQCLQRLDRQQVIQL